MAEHAPTWPRSLKEREAEAAWRAVESAAEYVGCVELRGDAAQTKIASGGFFETLKCALRRGWRRDG
jgi:hypothetical protein